MPGAAVLGEDEEGSHLAEPCLRERGGRTKSRTGPGIVSTIGQSC